MLGLPKTTELNKQLPKKSIYSKFQMNSVEKEKIDRDISRITIVNEVSPSKISLASGKDIKSIFVMSVLLKRKNFSEQTIVTLSKLIPQNLIMVLQYESEAKVAVYHTKLLQTEWRTLNKFSLSLEGLDFDKVWENIIIQIGDLELEEGNSIEDQIRKDDQKAKIKKEIERLEKQARTEKQPKKKYDLVKKVQKLSEDIWKIE